MKTKTIVKIGLFTAIICVMSAISIPTTPIPFTLSLIGIFLAGALLPPRDAFLACVCYLLLGIAGLPVFAGFRGGIQVILGYTGGFLLSYPLMALVISITKKQMKKPLSLIAGMVIALFILYTFGSLGFILVSGSTLSAALAACVLPYVFFDIIKIAVSFFFALSLEKAIKKME